MQDDFFANLDNLYDPPAASTPTPTSGLRPEPRQFAGRDTSKGKAYENILGEILRQGQYSARAQERVGMRLGATGHDIDWAVRASPDRRILVSGKWQSQSQTGPGTGEDKMPFEILTLGEVLRDRPKEFTTAYVVLGGMGWYHNKKKIEWYRSGKYRSEIAYSDEVHFIDTDEFLERVFRHTL